MLPFHFLEFMWNLLKSLFNVSSSHGSCHFLRLIRADYVLVSGHEFSHALTTTWRDHQCWRLLKDILQRIQVFLCKLEVQGLRIVRSLFDDGSNAVEWLTQTIRLKHDLFSLSLPVEHSLSLDSLCDIDRAPHFSLRIENLGSLDSLWLGLELHTPFDLCWWLDVLDFVPHAIDSPFLASLVKTQFYIGVKRISLLKGSIQLQSSNLGPHRSLC